MGELYVFELTNKLDPTCKVRVEMENDVRCYYGDNERMFTEIGNTRIVNIGFDINKQEIVLFVK